MIAYPLNIGGRPLNSWPSFIPVMFEMTVLFAALSAVLGMLAMNGLPRPHHPLFGDPAIRSGDAGSILPVHSGARSAVSTTRPTRQFLERLGPKEVIDVPL